MGNFVAATVVLRSSAHYKIDSLSRLQLRRALDKAQRPSYDRSSAQWRVTRVFSQRPLLKLVFFAVLVCSCSAPLQLQRSFAALTFHGALRQYSVPFSPLPGPASVQSDAPTLRPLQRS